MSVARRPDSKRVNSKESLGERERMVETSVTPPAIPQEWIRRLMVGGPAALFLFCALDFLWITEDAFITFQSVENLWAGYGPNFNRGLRVESFSHPLWFLVLCVLRVFGTHLLPLLAALVGVVLSVFGLVCAAESGRRQLHLARHPFPYGALLIACMYPFWQFASSGLETGMTFAWIGLSAWMLGELGERKSKWPRWAPLVFGVAPIIRPDLAVLALPLIAFWLWLFLSGRPQARDVVRATSLLIGPALVWQLFRMGYYGALVPNTYLAKEGLGSNWPQGMAYLKDLMSPYFLAPALGVGLLLAMLPFIQSNLSGSTLTTGERHVLISKAVMCAGALLHGFLVCRTGGDFMHGRLLLPALFAIVSVFAVVPMPESHGKRAMIVGVFFLWAGYICLFARPPYGSSIGPQGIADERQWYVISARTTRPVSLADYRHHVFYRIGEEATRLLREKRNRAVYWAHIGITSAMIPDDIVVIDPLALNDHIGARITLTTRGRPGHEKIVPAAWFLARYPGGSEGLVVTNQLDGVFRDKETQERIEAARSVLQTAPFRKLDEAVSAPLTLNLFVRNILRSWSLTFLRLPVDPVEALQVYGKSE